MLLGSFATVKFEVCYCREAVLGNYPFISPALVYPFRPSLSLILLTAAMGGSVLGNGKDNAGGILEIEVTGVGYMAECFFFFGRSALFDKFQQPCFWCDSWGSRFPNCVGVVT